MLKGDNMLKSPIFSYRIASGFAAGAVFTKDFLNKTENESMYQPFNSLTIDNFSGQRLRLRLNGKEKTIRGNSVLVIEEYGIRQFELENISGNVTDDIIEISIERQVTDLHVSLAKLTNKSIEDIVNGVGW